VKRLNKSILPMAQN